MPPDRVVYLFGAGATIAESSLFKGFFDETLSLYQLSDEVIRKAKKRKLFRETLNLIEQGDVTDIELYISLLESLHVRNFSFFAQTLTKLFGESIQEKIMVNDKLINPILEMALLQMHKSVEQREKLVGAISLNYDSLLDVAFNEVYKSINYGIKCKCVSGGYNLSDNCTPLIKLHGSFNWKRGYPYIIIDEQQAIQSSQAEMLWIPPSIGKIRDNYPFNILWGKALEILDCDILRIVGCRLSQNDWGLISLLFNTQLRQDHTTYKIEIINSEEAANDIKKRLGFLKNIYALSQIEGLKEIPKYGGTPNIFENWLRRKISLFREEGLCKGANELNYVNELMG